MKKGERRYNDGMSPALRYYYRNRENILQKLKGNPAVAARVKLYRQENIEKVREAERKRRIATKDQREAYFAKNHGTIEARRRARYGENRDAILAERRKQYAENPKIADAAKKQAKKWAEKNPDRVRMQKRIYASANPDKMRVLKSTQRARKRNATGIVSRDIVAKLMTLQRGQCAVCRCDLRKEKTHLDHIEPLALGGAHDDKNMQLLCKPCNLSKHAKPPIEFMQSRGFLL